MVSNDESKLAEFFFTAFANFHVKMIFNREVIAEKISIDVEIIISLLRYNETDLEEKFLAIFFKK